MRTIGLEPEVKQCTGWSRTPIFMAVVVLSTNVNGKYLNAQSDQGAIF